MSDEIRPMTPKPLEPYPMHLPDVTPKPVDVPVCDNPINDTVHWFDLIKLFTRESAISLILSMKKGIIMNNDQKTTVTGIATGIVALVGLFGLNWPLEAVIAIVTVGVTILGFFSNKKDTPAA